MVLRHAPRYSENMVRRGIYPIHPAELLPTSVENLATGTENPAETVPKREFDYSWFTGAQRAHTMGGVAKNHYVERRGEVRRSHTF